MMVPQSELSIEQVLARSVTNDVPEAKRYSRANGGEVVPGVATPLTADFMRLTSGAAMCFMFHQLGAISTKERGPAADGSESTYAGRFGEFFYGRLSSDFDFVLDILARIPGVDAAAIEEQLTGERSTIVRPGGGIVRSAVAAGKIVATLASHQRRVDRYEAQERRWWTGHCTAMQTADLATARAGWTDAVHHMRRGQALQCVTAALHPGSIEPVLKVARKHVSDEQASLVIAGAATLEADVLNRLWAVAREDQPLDAFILTYGFYGPNAGELASPSWRADPGGLTKTLASYRALPEDRSPRTMMATRHRESLAARSQLRERQQRLGGTVTATLIARADKATALREKGKTLMLMGADAARAAALRIGALLAAQGTLERANEAFYLTAGQLTHDSTAGLQAIISERMAQRTAYERIVMPIDFHGGELAQVVREQLTRLIANEPPDHAAVTQIVGEGVSSGVHTGVARIVHDPRDADLNPGDVLVCSTTDPGWAPLMTLASAIVLDMGSALSHGAIVARELGIPCVANTTIGTTAIREGATITVIGSTGTIDIVTE